MRSNGPTEKQGAGFLSGQFLTAKELFDLNRNLSFFDEYVPVSWVRGVEAPLAILGRRDGVWRFAGASMGWLHALELSGPEIEARLPEEVLSREAALPLIQAADRVHAGVEALTVVVPVRLPERRARRITFTLHALSDTTVLVEVVSGARTAGRADSVAVLRAELEERRRIARELHDSMAQHLVIIDLTLSRMQREAGDALPSDAVEDIRNALRVAHGEVRTFSYLLHPPDLERLGLAGAMGKFAAGFGVRTGLEVNLRIDPLPVLDALSGLTLFRIAQEALMNVHRHAHAAQVDVSLHIVDGEVVLEVADDGIGAEPGQIEQILINGAAGVGIPGMKGRLEQLDGRLHLDGGPDGFRLSASLPVRPG